MQYSQSSVSTRALLPCSVVIFWIVCLKRAHCYEEKYPSDSNSEGFVERFELVTSVEYFVDELIEFLKVQEDNIDFHVDDFTSNFHNVSSSFLKLWKHLRFAVPRPTVSYFVNATRDVLTMNLLLSTKLHELLLHIEHLPINAENVSASSDAFASGKLKHKLIRKHVLIRRPVYTELLRIKHNNSRLYHQRKISKLKHINTFSKRNSLKTAFRRPKRGSVNHDAIHSKTFKNSGNRSQMIPPKNNTHFCWWRPIKILLRYLSRTNNWYYFLHELSKKLSSSDVQISKRYQFCGTLCMLLNNKTIDATNLKEVLPLLIDEYGISFSKNRTQLLVKSYSDIRLFYLNEVINTSLKYMTFCETIENTTFVQGSFVFLTDIEACNYTENITTISLIAGQKLFIDSDFNSTKINSAGSIKFLLVIAPILEIVGDNMDLNISGKQGTTLFNDFGDGPGTPGRNGWNLIFIVGNAIGGLEIHSFGGNGGPGQTPEDAYLAGFYCENKHSLVDSIAILPKSGAAKVLCCSSSVKFIYNGKKGGQGSFGAPGGHLRVFNMTFLNMSFNSLVGTKGDDGRSSQGYITANFPNPNDLASADIIHVEDNELSYFCSLADNVAQTEDFLPSTLTVLSDQKHEIKILSNVRQETSQQREKEYAKNVVKTLLIFKKCSRKTSFLFQRRFILDFMVWLDEDRFLKSVYSNKDLIEEFTDLDDQNIDLIFRPSAFYDSLEYRVLQRIRKKSKTGKIDMRLKYLFGALLSQKSSNYDLVEPTISSNIDDALNNEVKILTILYKRLERLDFQAVGESFLLRYNNKIRSQFSDLINLVDDIVFAKLPELQMSIAYTTKDLFVDLIKAINENNPRKILVLRNELKKNSFRSYGASEMKIIAEILLFMVPIGSAISLNKEIVPASTGCKSKLLNHHLSDDDESKRLLQSLEYTADRIRKHLEIEGKAYCYSFSGQMNESKNVLVGFADIYQQSLASIDKTSAELATVLRDCLRANKPVNSSFFDFFRSFDCFFYIHFDISRSRSNLMRDIDWDRHTFLFNKTNMTDPAVTYAADLAIAILSPVNQKLYGFMNETEYREEAASLMLSNHNFLRYIPNKSITDLFDYDVMLNITDFLSAPHLTRGAKYQAESSFKVIVALLLSLLDKIEHDILYFSSIFEKDSELNFLLDALREGLFSVLCQHEKSLAFKDYYISLNMLATLMPIYASSNNLSMNNSITVQKRHQNDSISLACVMIEHILNSRMNYFELSYKIWLLPQTEDRKRFPMNIKLGNCTHLSLLKFVNTSITQMEERLQEVNFARYSPLSKQQYVKFAHDLPTSSLVTWRYQSHPFLANRLLQGASVLLTADPFVERKFCDSIKLRKVWLNITSAAGDEAAANRLTKVLRNFAVSIKHTTTNYFQYKKGVYSISNNEIELFFSFATDESGTPYMYNREYESTLTGKLVLSPFSTWIMSLDAFYQRKMGFKPLEEFVPSRFDIHLEGEAVCTEVQRDS